MKLQDVQVGMKVKRQNEPTYRPPAPCYVDSISQPRPGNKDGWVVVTVGGGAYGYPPQELEPWTVTDDQAQRDFFAAEKVRDKSKKAELDKRMDNLGKRR